MIRVPFFPLPQSKSELDPSSRELRDETPALENTAAEDRIEARLSSLELRLVAHAEELKMQVSQRVMRIQSRVERALRPFQPDSERKRVERSADNIIEFGADVLGPDSDSKRLLHARNARAAMHELNDTLRLTQEHLEALSGSIERMRRSVAGR